jgi:hypothetical protein
LKPQQLNNMDIFKGIETVGKWEAFGWGARWELTNEEIDRALAKIDVQRNAWAAYFATGSAVASLPSAGTVGVALGAAGALWIGFFEILKSRIKSVNVGNGVIVDFALDPNPHSRSEWSWSRLAGGVESSPFALNFSNITPRR